MSVEMMHQVSRYCYIIASVLSCLEIVICFRFNIWKVIGDFTGTNKKRELKAIYKKEQICQENRYELFEIQENNNLQTEQIHAEELTGLLENEIVYDKFVLIEELEFVGSQQWIE